MRHTIALLLAALLALGLSACGETDPDQAQESIQVFAMDTAMIFSAYGENGTKAVYDAEEEAYRLEALLSRTREESEVSALNGADGAKTAVGTEVRSLLQASAEYSRSTGGAFDITIAPVASAWGFTGKAYRVPAQSELDALLPLVGMEHVHTEGGGAWLDPGTQIDLGGIAKGYASDVVADIFRAREVPRGLASLGGNVLAWGDKPDGTAWRVGIQDPRHPDTVDAYAGILNLKDCYAVTSGGYERRFEENGTTYHHIIDPATGYPAESGLTSVTVVADAGGPPLNGAPGNGTMCDALSTALFVMGADAAVDFWRSGIYDFQMVLVTEDGRVLVTDGLADAFTQAEGSGYAYETVS